jgi:tRNA (adenine37-N6)-methyltransferase
LKEICYKPIGIIHSPFKELEGMPIQPVGAAGVEGSIELRLEYVAGLKDITGFSHIFLIYDLHLSKPGSLLVRPFLDTEAHGIFATRSPSRPNRIGISVVKLKKIEGNNLFIEDVDVLDGTPLLDIKPYVPEFDDRAGARTGWLENKSQKARDLKSDRRFISGQ